MPDNPYQYHGPLDPEDNKLVCSYRENEVKRVIQRITRGDYWTILGPRQIGKTTFLHLVKSQFKHADYIYFDFQVPHSTEKEFYQWLVRHIQEKIPHKRTKAKAIQSDSPAMSFFNFLVNFNPKIEKKIILMFDEVVKIPFIKSFLPVWRKVFNERIEKRELFRYTVITTGSIELVKLTIGPTSPFNIAEVLYLKDLSEEESKKIIEKPFAELNIEIDPKAKQKLISQISGHPQMLQHACHLLVEKANSSGRTVTENHVDEAIGRLLTENSILKTLKGDILSDETLKNLVHDLLIEKKEKIFHPYSDYALLGAGAIKEGNTKCKIRNKVFEKFTIDILSNPIEKPTPGNEMYPSTHPVDEGTSKKVKAVFTALFTFFSILTIIIAVLMAPSSILIISIILALIVLSPVLIIHLFKKRKKRLNKNEQK